LARPGGNATGFTLFEYSLSGKWLELLKQIAPGVTRVAVIRDPATPQGIGQFSAVYAVAPSLGLDVIISPINASGASSSRSSAVLRLRGRSRRAPAAGDTSNWVLT
jgi:putative ABC transport system substrate-binding protein